MRRRVTLLLLSLVALDVLLFVPGFVFSHQRADVLPFFPREHPHGAFGFDLRSAFEYVKALFLRRANLDAFRVCVEFVALVAALVLSARTRLRGLARWASVALYTFSLLFLTYHAAIGYYFLRAPALSQDVQLLASLGHFLSEMGVVYWLGFGVGGVATLGAMGFFAAFVFRATQQWSLDVPLVRLSGGLTAALVTCVASVAWFGPWRDDPVVQALSKRFVENARASRQAALQSASLEAALPDRRYDVFEKVRLTRRPSFFLLTIEAYGEVLATWDMREAWRALLSRVERRLSAKGLAAVTFYSAAPVHGGWSWFSIATTQTGTLIDTPQTFAAFEDRRERVPTLTRFFKQQGYTTWALHPGSVDRPGLVHDLYSHDLLMNADAINYQGRRWGFGGIPDQYSLTWFSEHAPRPRPEPLYLFYMAVSTHYPWGDHVPPWVKDARDLERGVVEPSEVDASWPALEETARIGSDYRRSYFQSVAYEWRALTELLEREATKDLVVVILGDHQPRLESNPPGEVTLNTPVHVLSTDAALLERFVELGAQRGLYAEAGAHEAVQHEGLFSLFVSTLAAQYGDEASKDLATWSRDGAGLSGLNR